MTPPTVWLNQHLTNTWHALRHWRQTQPTGEFRLLSTHKSPRYPGGRFSDFFEPEPRHPRDGEYVDFCLGLAKKYAVNVFYPWRKLSAILAARDRFEALGVRIFAVADLPTLTLLDSKVRQYRALDPTIVPIPDYEVVSAPAQFDAAVERLRARGRRVCYKPAVSIFGIGFHILDDTDEGRRRWQAGDPVLIPTDAARQALTAKNPFRELIVMQHLPGPERSIDCLADHGKLLRCVVRCKSMKDYNRQTIEKNEAVEEIARRLTEKFRLNALFNIQLRDADGIPYLLEINPRMSGGVPAVCGTGLNLVYWAIRLALGTAAPEEIPHPHTGVPVNTKEFPGSL